MSPTGIHLNYKASIVIIVGLCAGLAVLYRFYWKADITETKMESAVSGDTWYSGMLTVPEEVVKAAKSTKIVKDFVDVPFEHAEGKKLRICKRVSEPSGTPRGDVLLLHGEAFTSDTWATKCPTLQFLAAAGFRTVAVDLPGYGESDKTSLTDNKRGAFIGALIQTLKMTTPVIVSPSMSGTFSLPFLFGDPQTVLTRSKGFVPVAPVVTDKFAAAFKTGGVQIPTAIVTGDKDGGIGPRALNDLKLLPNSKDFTLKDARHPAYLDAPDTWHAILYTFLNAVYKI